MKDGRGRKFERAREKQMKVGSQLLLFGGQFEPSMVHASGGRVMGVWAAGKREHEDQRSSEEEERERKREKRADRRVSLNKTIPVNDEEKAMRESRKER